MASGMAIFLNHNVDDFVRLFNFWSFFLRKGNKGGDVITNLRNALSKCQSHVIACNSVFISSPRLELKLATCEIRYLL